MHLILASASPRRREILRQAGYRFTALEPPHTGESFFGDDPGEAVCRIAREKARAASAAWDGGADALFLTADTVVILEGAVLGKPVGEEEAVSMLLRLAGRWHSVWTGVCLWGGGRTVSFAQQTRVRMIPRNDAWIRAYVRTGEPLDKAGAYGIQGKGAALVEQIRGEYLNVVGLPLVRLARILWEDYRIGPFGGSIETSSKIP